MSVDIYCQGESWIVKESVCVEGGGGGVMFKNL